LSTIYFGTVLVILGWFSQSAVFAAPMAKGIQTILDWSKRADARKATPAQFIQTRFVEKFDNQGFIDGLYKK
jgi:hypothetical protein